MPRDYYWYDTDDGQDVVKKVNFAAKMSAITSFPVVAFDWCFVSLPKTLPQYGYRFAIISGTLVGMSSVFAFTSQLLCREFPKMNPKAGYAAGGFLAGTLVGAVRRNAWAGCLTGTYLALIAPVIRIGHEEKWHMPWEHDLHPAWNDTEFGTSDMTLSKKKNLDPPASYPGWGI